MNIYLVESPMQLLSAIEAKEYFQDKNSLLIVKNVLKDDYNKVMSELITFSKWNKIIKIKYPLSTYVMLYHLFKLKISKTKINNIFIGFPKTRTFQWFCENLNNNKIFLLDEGVATINFQNNFFIKKNYLQKNDFLYIKKEKKTIQKIKNIFKIFIKRYIFNLRGKNKIIYNLFSCFQLKINSEQEYYCNKYNYTKKQISNLNIKKDMIYFYGSPLSENNIINFNIEIKLLNKIKKNYQNKILFYIPHPSDSKKKILYLQKIGFKIKKNDTMAEIEPIKSQILPEEISSFLSTTLYTLPKIYHYTQVLAFKIPNEHINSRLQAIEKLYNEYEKDKDIKVISI